ncbi:MAG TPA: carbamoyltransferase HypF [Terracidiphilus sp.]
MCGVAPLGYAELTKAANSYPESSVDSSSASRRIRKAVCVRGVVQGVGFRPFVYRLALQSQLGGHVGNDTNGVTIEVEGTADAVEEFLRRLSSEAPLISRIDSVEVEETAPTGETTFAIVHSQVLGQASTGIPADAATCDDCLRELLDRRDRRYRYPFLNCTNCGPRFTITRRIPYDRPQTSMADFPMCRACQAEYDDPMNRRFHAQPNACWDCGPRVWLESPQAEEMVCDDPVLRCIEELLDGRILSIKGIGGFHLAVDASNETAVMRLRERKHRYGKPLAVMVRDMEAAQALCVLGEEEAKLLQTPARPIVLARARSASGIAPSVAPGIPWLGIYLPYAPLQHLLFADDRVRALVMTSANLSEEPIAIDNDEARTRLGNIADGFLMHNREILQRCDDSVTAIVDSAPQFIRRARGYVPLRIDLPFDSPPLLAVGGHLKSVFTLVRGRFAYQSQHLGDLESVAGLDFFTESLAHLMRTFEIEPQAVVHDLHPGYLSTLWAKQWAAEHNLPAIAVQHHHAHIAACMAEHATEGSVIGLSLDGTGYGTDGHIWGGEVLIVNRDGFERFAHLEYVALPGGDAAVREPWRVAFAHLLAVGLAEVEARELSGATEPEARLLSRMIERGINAPLTSSLGRLFDAVAAVVLARRKVDYEAQAAIELEGLAIDEPDEVSGYDFDLIEGDWATREPMRINAAPLWREIVRDLRTGVSQAHIAARFHAGVANAFARIASAARDATGISIVAMSGGVVHNRRLTRMLRRRLEAEGFKVMAPRRVSPGDGGLSYGQAVIAGGKLRTTQLR